jgi:hypothetical protein
MARVLISKATLADFGVPRQEMAVRQPMPTAEEMERIIREGDIALTPRQYATKVPLIEREESDAYKGHKGMVEREGKSGRAFGRSMGTEGAIAQGLIAREHPQVAGLDPQLTPFLRDYYSRQSTLPEHLWDYHTEGPYYDEEGNILPGQVPPVNAIKVMGKNDIAQMGTREGFGLKPVPFSRINMNWEKDIRAKHRFPSKKVGFVGALSGRDIFENTEGNAPTEDGRGVVGVRGYGRPQDKAFARGRVAEGIESGFTAPIPPERLVGVMPRTRMSKDELVNGALKHLYGEKLSFEAKLQQMVSDGEISPMDAIFATIRRKTIENEKSRGDDFLSFLTDDEESPHPHPLFPTKVDNLQGSDAGKTLLEQRISDLGTPYKHIQLSPAINATSKTDRAFEDALPLAWKEGVFGFENPLLTEEEKRQYLEDIKEAEGRRNSHMQSISGIDEMEPSELRSLYPTQAGVKFG